MKPALTRREDAPGAISPVRPLSLHLTDLNFDNKADDTLVLVPAVGAGGRIPLVQGPLTPFLQ